MLPLLFFGLVTYVVLGHIAAKPRSVAPASTQVSGARYPTEYLRELKAVISSGGNPQRWLVDEAMREAFDLGHWHTVAKLTAFQTQPAPAKKELAEEKAHGENPLVVVGKNSPIEGVDNDEWSEFVDKLKTQKPEFSDERHVGAWHHNKERLAELGLSDLPSDEDAQYQALEKDIADRNAKCKKIIQDFAGDVISVDGKTHGVTLSGILGLIKSAGPKGATLWLKDDKDRKAHPKTTEMFLRTNGLF